MVGLTKHNMLLPLRGGFCESSQIAMTSSAHRMVGRFIPWASSSPWALPMAGRLSPLQGVNGWCAPKGQLSGNTVCNAVTKLRDAGNDAGMCAPKGQPSGSPMATPWATETPWAMVTSSATITPSATATPVSATNEKCITAPKGHKHQEYGTIAL